MKVLDYEGLKQVVAKIKSLIDLKASKSDLNKLLQDLKIQDTRNTNENPIYYIKNKSKQVVKEFKILKSVGVNTSSDYGVLFTMFPWQNNSAGFPVQVMFILKADAIYTRRGTGDTSWGRWRKILDDTDLKTKLSELTQDSTHRLVTDAEKAKWNAKAEVSYVNSTKATIEKNTKTLTDALAKDLRENVDSINATKADKTALGAYAKNDRLTALERNMLKEADVRKWAAEAANADTFFSEQSRLGQMINDSYGTNLSTNIRNLDDLINSTTALKSTFSNANATKYTAKSMLFYEKLANNAGAMNVLLDTPSAMSLVVEEAGALGMLAQSTVALDEMYKRKKTLRFREEVSGGKYIVLNARHARPGSSVYTANAYYLVPNGDYTESEAPLEGKYVNLKRRPKYYIKLHGGESSHILLEYLEIK